MNTNFQKLFFTIFKMSFITLFLFFIPSIDNSVFLKFNYTRSLAKNEYADINSDQQSYLNKESVFTIYIIVSLIWNGQDILDHNVSALKNFRLQFLDIPFNHFISPTYFIKKNKVTKKNIMSIKSVINDKDTYGIFLASWKSLILGADVTFEEKESFMGSKVLKPLSDNEDYGLDIPFVAYQEEELNKILDYSLKVLHENKFYNINTSMIAGWLASEKILKTLAKKNIKYDCSAIPLNIINNQIQNYPLYDLLQNLWNNISIFSSPYKLTFDQADIIEVPQNGGMLEYFGADEITSIFQEYIKHHKAQQTTNQYIKIFHIAFHHSMALESLKKLEIIIKNIFLISQKERFNIKFVALSDKSELNLYSILSNSSVQKFGAH